MQAAVINGMALADWLIHSDEAHAIAVALALFTYCTWPLWACMWQDFQRWRRG